MKSSKASSIGVIGAIDEKALFISVSKKRPELEPCNFLLFGDETPDEDEAGGVEK